LDNYRVPYTQEAISNLIDIDLYSDTLYRRSTNANNCINVNYIILILACDIKSNSSLFWLE